MHHRVNILGIESLREKIGPLEHINASVGDLGL